MVLKNENNDLNDIRLEQEKTIRMLDLENRHLKRKIHVISEMNSKNYEKFVRELKRVKNAIHYIEQENWDTEYDRKLLDILSSEDYERRL